MRGIESSNIFISPFVNRHLLELSGVDKYRHVGSFLKVWGGGRLLKKILTSKTKRKKEIWNGGGWRGMTLQFQS